MIEVKLTDEKLSSEQAIHFVQAADNGGISVFIGTVRNHTKEKKVLHLDFEAYKPMAIKEMTKLCNQAKAQWDISKIALYHRVGHLAVGEIPVIIAVSSAHRAAAIEACRFLIDTLKVTVPIWKKEYFEDGEVWVAAHP